MTMMVIPGIDCTCASAIIRHGIGTFLCLLSFRCDTMHLVCQDLFVNTQLLQMTITHSSEDLLMHNIQVLRSVPSTYRYSI